MVSTFGVDHDCHIDDTKLSSIDHQELWAQTIFSPSLLGFR
jgi:hypothetical protein